MFIKLKWCENPKTENDYVYINPNYIVSIYHDCRSARNDSTIVETVNTGSEQFLHVANSIKEIMEMIEKTKC